MPDIDRGLITEQFPTLASMTYLNNAATGIPPQKTVESMTQYLRNHTEAIGKFQDTLKLFKEIRQNLAKLLGGDYSQYGFVPSTSAGLNSFAHSIDYPDGSNIVLCDQEFPANYVPWQNVCRLRNVELRVVRSVDGAIPIDAFKEQIDERTRVVAVSHVQFSSGFKTDLKELANFTHKHSGYLVSDIIQSAGWSNIDLVGLNVDFATAQSAKWLIGPVGGGFVYVRKQIIDKLRPTFLGWWGVKNLMEFGYAEREPLEDARKFQVGSPAVVAYVGFAESLKILLSIPADVRERTAISNATYLRQRLSEIGIDHYNFGTENNSPIVSSIPADVEEIHKQLVEKKIHCSVRNGRLRVSPHFYNTHAEIDTLVDTLR
ncbi:MAG: aminotransferase class V-fold PLP-dependent enzyme [Candidatus Thorarchaeota archaeon]